MRRTPILLTFLLLFPATPALADAGGPDAAGTRAAAGDVPFGTHEGALGGDDRVDYYRIPHAAGKGVRVEVSSSASLFVGLEGEWPGLWLDRGETPGTVTLVANGAAAGAVWFRASVWPGEGNASVSYAFTATEVDLPDLAVADVRVLAASGDTRLPGPLGAPRRIEVDITSTGPVDFATTLHVGVHTPTDGARSAEWRLPVTITPGATTYAFSWDATGVVGDARIVARLWTSSDLDPNNNVKAVRHQVLLDGKGHGVAPVGSSQVLCSSIVVGLACAWTDTTASPSARALFAGGHAAAFVVTDASAETGDKGTQGTAYALVFPFDVLMTRWHLHAEGTPSGEACAEHILLGPRCAAA
jgi:hypothetical protein